MSKHSVTYNFSLNLINTIAGLLFPIFTFPYASRVLGPDGIGTIGFLNSIIYYITLFSALGISMYGIREVARHSHDKARRDRTTVEILLLHAATTIAGYIMVAAVGLSVGQVHAQLPLFLILSVSILFNTFGINWFYQGIEDFTYITVRSVLVKLLAAVMLFTMVRDADDLMIYAIVVVVADSGNNLFNIMRLQHHISLKGIAWQELRIWRHLRPTINIFALSAVISLYTEMAPLILGFVCGEEAVGYLNAASRIEKAALSIVITLSTTLLPRMSSLISLQKNDEFVSLQNKSFNLAITLALPISLGLFLVSPVLMPVFGGHEFVPGVGALRYVSLSIIPISVASVIGYQILYPLGKERIIIISSGAGAITALAMMWWLSVNYQQTGAAVGLLLAETVVTTTMIVLGRKHLDLHIINRNILSAVVATGVMSVCVLLTARYTSLDYFTTLVAEIAAGIISYVVALTVMGNELARKYILRRT